MIIRFLGSIVRLLALVLAAVTVCVAVSTNISPERLGALCLAWFAFPYMWMTLCVAAVMYVLKRHWITAAICVAAIVFTFPEAHRVIDLPMKQEEHAEGEGKGLKLLTYNIYNLLLETPEGMPVGRGDSMARDIKALGADIVCLQEANREYDRNESPKLLQFKQMCKGFENNVVHRDLRILTNLPLRQITDPHELGRNGQMPDFFLAADVTIGQGKTIRIFNCHMASLRLSEKQLGAVSKSNIDSERAEALRSTYSKTMDAFVRRAVEVRELAQAVTASPYPVIVCGDFNDTPISYTYSHLMKAQPQGDTMGPLSEARHSAHLKMRRTFRRKLPPLQIDYIIKSGAIRTWGYEDHDWAWSDHRAVSVYFDCAE